jgi:ABC-type cobalamin/Fe3+-siderophores transport system ATPase subunit
VSQFVRDGFLNIFCTPETFIVVSGPKGSGKSALVKGVTDKMRYTIIMLT